MASLFLWLAFGASLCYSCYSFVTLLHCYRGCNRCNKCNRCNACLSICFFVHRIFIFIGYSITALQTLQHYRGVMSVMSVIFLSKVGSGGGALRHTHFRYSQRLNHYCVIARAFRLVAIWLSTRNEIPTVG